jgi:tetratricopeptide (TPR) repeat protein
MAKRKKNRKQDDETLVDLVEARDNAQDFMEKYQNLIFGAVAGVVLLVGGYFAYQTFVIAPKDKEAVAQIWKAEQRFQIDSFSQALTNPEGGYPGLNDFVEEYKGSSTTNAANYYAGISYLQLGQFEAAISYLKDVKADGTVLAIMKNGALGDAYAELGEMDKALSFYKKAAQGPENDGLSPIYMMRYAMLLENQGKTDAAIKIYQEVDKKYGDTAIGRDAEKYLVKLGAL